MSRPRVIRKVSKTTRDGRVKVAIDRKARLTVERIEAHVDHQCESRGHRLDGNREIRPGEEYVRLTYLGETRWMGRRPVPLSYEYHLDCLPPEARPLVRFFKET